MGLNKGSFPVQVTMEWLGMLLRVQDVSNEGGQTNPVVTHAPLINLTWRDLHDTCQAVTHHARCVSTNTRHHQLYWNDYGLILRPLGYYFAVVEKPNYGENLGNETRVTVSHFSSRSWSPKRKWDKEIFFPLNIFMHEKQ